MYSYVYDADKHCRQVNIDASLIELKLGAALIEDITWWSHMVGILICM